MKLMRTLKWLIVRLIMQMKCRTSLMRNHEALSLGRSYPDKCIWKDVVPVMEVHAQSSDKSFLIFCKALLLINSLLYSLVQTSDPMIVYFTHKHNGSLD